MTPPFSQTRKDTIALIAASIPLTPDAVQVRAQLALPDLDWDDVLYLADGHGITPLLYRVWEYSDL
jgi:hypothetical protein